MKVELINSYIHKRRSCQDKEYLLHTIAYHIPPVLEKLKPAIILTFTGSRRSLSNLWGRYKQFFPVNAELNYFEINKTGDKVSVLFYNPQLLTSVLKQPEYSRFLLAYGYTQDMSLTECLDHLKNRYNSEFPHEIGAFLGIPLQDIISFIENNGKNSIGCGYWKVYHDLHKAKQIFSLYEKAQVKFMKFILNGNQPQEYFASY